MKPVKCKCGKPVKVDLGGTKQFSIFCPSETCWMGPVRKTERGAIAAWNAVMRKAKEGK